MKTFGTYFEFGIEHILQWAGLDHILFILALCALYTLRDWRRVLILVTAFTVGHSLTLALAVTGLVKVNSAYIEFLIPVTILITALSNIFRTNSNGTSRVQLNYAYAAFFGLIHGLGFANFLGSLVGRGTKLFWPLLAFNIGLEVGQIIIVLIFLLIAGLLVAFGNVSKREWTLGVSSFIAGMAMLLVIQSKFW
jgi:hypothetical protein